MHETGPLIKFLEGLMPQGLTLLQRMVEVNSFTGNAEGVNRLGRLTAEAFAPLGFSAEYVASSNAAWGRHLVLTRRGRGAKTVAMVSHLDTVFPPEEEARNNFHWQVEGERIYGPGTHDIKGGTVMMWLVLSALQKFERDAFETTTWQLFFNSSEEALSQDFGEVCRARLEPGTSAALVFEAEGRQGDTRLLVRSRKGRATWRATAVGRGAHAGSKHAHGANAILELARIVERIAGLTDYGRELTFNVGIISGGAGLNRVPHEAVAEGELRAFSPEVYESGKAALLALAGPGSVRSAANEYRCQARIEILSESRPWPRNAATDRLLELWRGVAETLGIKIGGEDRGGLSDGNLLWEVVPTLDGLGPWGNNDHCSERSADGTKVPEYVEPASFVPKGAMNVLGIIQMLQI